MKVLSIAQRTKPWNLLRTRAAVSQSQGQRSSKAPVRVCIQNVSCRCTYLNTLHSEEHAVIWGSINIRGCSLARGQMSRTLDLGLLLYSLSSHHVFFFPSHQLSDFFSSTCSPFQHDSSSFLALIKMATNEISKIRVSFSLFKKLFCQVFRLLK